MKPPIKNIFVLERPRHRKAALCQTVSQSVSKWMRWKLNRQTDRQKISYLWYQPIHFQMQGVRVQELSELIPVPTELSSSMRRTECGDLNKCVFYFNVNLIFVNTLVPINVLTHFEIQYERNENIYFSIFFKHKWSCCSLGCKYPILATCL